MILPQPLNNRFQQEISLVWKLINKVFMCSCRCVFSFDCTQLATVL